MMKSKVNFSKVVLGIVKSTEDLRRLIISDLHKHVEHHTVTDIAYGFLVFPMTHQDTVNCIISEVRDKLHFI